MSAPRVLVLAAVFLVAASAGAAVISTWRDPTASSAVRKLLVPGVSAQTNRRIFKDAFVQALGAKGAEAVAIRTLLPDPGPQSRGPLAKLLERSGADALAVTRLVERDTRTRVDQNPVPVTPERVPASASPDRWYPGAWSGYYEPPTIRQYDVAVIETQVFRAAGGGLAWSAASGLAPSGRLAGGLARVTADLVTALAKDGLL